MIPLNDIYVLLPAYNEGGSIRDVIKGLREQGINNIVVVDDGSSDFTARKARSMGAMVVQHFVNRGAGAAIQTGIEVARHKNWKYIALMDSDGQHDPTDILNLMKQMSDTDCDIVIGSRFMKKGISAIPKTRIIFNWIANVMTNFFCRNNYSDSQSGLRLLNRNAIEKINLQLDGFGFCSEMLIKAEKTKLKITETPTKVLYTDYSISKGQDLHNGITTAFNLLWNTLFK